MWAGAECAGRRALQGGTLGSDARSPIIMHFADDGAPCDCWLAWEYVLTLNMRGWKVHDMGLSVQRNVEDSLRADPQQRRTARVSFAHAHVSWRTGYRGT